MNEKADVDLLELAVRRGAALLDQKIPGWHKRVDLATLAFPDVTTCVLGQQFGTVQAGYAAIDLPGLTPDEEEAESYYGFNTAFGRWDETTELWRREIEQRKASTT